MTKQLIMHNDDVKDAAESHTCQACQCPGACLEAITGEWFHPGCLPEELTP